MWAAKKYGNKKFKRKRRVEILILNIYIIKKNK